MNRPKHDFQVVPYTKLRRVLEIMYSSLYRKPMIHGLFEVDVTRVRVLLHEHGRATGESMSFTAFILKCLAHAIDQDKTLQAYPKGSRHLVIFDSVDVALPIERTMDGMPLPVVYIVRSANTKSLGEIHREIREAQVKQVDAVWEGFTAVSSLRLLPMAVFRVGWWIFCWLRHTYPQVQKKYGGTVGITSVGMFGKKAGWGIPLNDHSLDLTLGGIEQKPALVDGQVAVRECLSITLSVNHAIIDGAPAARFAQRLTELIESGYGLDEALC